VQRLVGTDELRAALASSVLPGTTLVWREGMKEWAAASTRPELAESAIRGSKSPPSEGRASQVGLPEQAVPEATKNGAKPPRPKLTAAGPLMLPNVPTKRPQAPTMPPRGSMNTLIGGVHPRPEQAASPGAPIMVPSPNTARVAVTQIPLQGTTPARIDALEIPRAPGLPQTAGKARPAPQRKMTTREIDGEWAAPELSDEDATHTQLTRPTREELTKDASGGEVRTAGAVDEAKSGAAKPIEAVSAPTTGSAAGPLATKLTAPTITAPSKPTSLPLRATPHRPPVATRPTPLKVPVALPPLPPGTKPFVFPSAPAVTPAPTAVGASAANEEGVEDEPTADLLLEADEGPVASTTKLSQGLAEAALSASQRLQASHPSPDAVRISSPPPPLPKGVTITTTALFPPSVLEARSTPHEAPVEAVATAPSAAPVRASMPTRPLPPNLNPAQAAAAAPAASPHPAPQAAPRAVSQAAPAAAALSRPPSNTTSRPASAPASQKAPAATSRAQVVEAPPATSLNGPVAVPVGSLFGAGGALICMVVTAFFVGRCSAQPPPQLARPQLQAIPVLARVAIPPPPKACWVTRQPVMWAPRASKTIPFEVTATKEGALAIGYARDAKEAMGILVSPSSGEVKAAFSKASSDDLDRVTPSSAGEFRLVTAAKEGAISSIIPVAAATPFVIGVQAGSIVAADREDASASPLWPLAGAEAPSAARVQIAESRGYALVFRREGAIWSGWLGADKKPVGELVKVVGSGGQVGKPNIGWNHRELALIFADKPASSDHYEIRIAHAKTGSIPDATIAIPLPKGGPGGDAFAPDIAGLPDGRWVMVWTEGASGSRAIRAQTFDHDFTPLGDPIALSPPAGNFGQGVLGVVGGYAAAVFLSKGTSSYELWGSVLQCG